MKLEEIDLTRKYSPLPFVKQNKEDLKNDVLKTIRKPPCRMRKSDEEHVNFCLSCSTKAFSLRRRWHGGAVTDEVDIGQLRIRFR